MIADTIHNAKIRIDEQAYIMRDDADKSQIADFIDESHSGISIQFDLDQMSLQGSYLDELSCHRAKRVWKEVLERTFLLKKDQDFILTAKESSEENAFLLLCLFDSPSGRYVLWRLANDQAPESQYTIETAHVPDSTLMHDSFISAPDMIACGSTPTILGEASDSAAPLLKNICERIKELAEKINLKS